MPVYAARVLGPTRRWLDTTEENAPSHIMEEFMIDNIRAKNQKSAIVRALSSAKGYVSLMFRPPQIALMPEPTLVGISRLKADGTPVTASFDKKARVNLLGENYSRKPTKPKQTALALVPEVKAAAPVEVVSKPTFRAVELPDPFTDDILTQIMEVRSETK